MTFHPFQKLKRTFLKYQNIENIYFIYNFTVCFKQFYFSYPKIKLFTS